MERQMTKKRKVFIREADETKKNNFVLTNIFY